MMKKNTPESQILERLRLDQAQLSILAAIDDSLSIQDRDFRIVYQNQRAIDVFGKHTGEYCYAVFQGRENVCEDCQAVKVFADAKSHRAERQVQGKGGSRYFEVTSSPLKNGQGEVIAAIEIARDITERQLAINELRLSQEKYRDLVENIKDWIWEVDAQGVYTYVSPQITEILGYTSAEVIGKTPFDLMPPSEAKKIGKQFAVIVSLQKPFTTLENENRHKDGRRVLLESSGVPFFDRAGKLLGYRGVDRDVTSRKQLEMELEISAVALRENNLALEQKNVALKEVLSQIELEKNNLRQNISANVENLLYPIVDKLWQAQTPQTKLYIEMLRHNLENLTSAFGHKVSDKQVRLAPREIEICALIKQGLNNKEIAQALHISLKTVETHRKRIRSKFGLVKRNVNLTTYLQSIK